MELLFVKRKIVDYLSRRDHSLAELKTKLSRFIKEDGDKEIVLQGLEWAEKHKYLKAPEEIAELMVRQLHQKLKGAHYIRQFLAKKKLPTDYYDAEMELEKAKQLFEKKGRNVPKEKFFRFLLSRGFEMHIAREVIREKY